MRLRSHCDQRVRVDELDLDVTFAAGEEMRTEISAKFTREGLREELAASGFVGRGGLDRSRRGLPAQMARPER